LHIPGVGVDLTGKITELARTGKLEYFEALKKEIPGGLLEIMSIPGIGPKTTKLLYEQLNIDSVAALEKAAHEHRISAVPGLKEKTEENILKGIELLKHKHDRTLLSTAMSVADRITRELSGLAELSRMSVAGSVRRKKETVQDIDILATSTHPKKIMDVFTALVPAGEVIAHGATKSAVRTSEGIQVDLRVVDPDSFGAALVYFTGSKEHNIAIRELAKKNGLKINEYGVFREKDEHRVAGATEEDVYAALRLPFIPPELRENQGEIEAAARGTLPKLIERSRVRADLHVHSEWSDGNSSIEVMAAAARKQGYEYMVISDHSQSLGVANGLSPARVREQIAHIAELNKKFRNFRILCGTEVDIKADGTLDFSDDILQQFDVVLAAVHSGFKQSRDQMTARIVKAMHNPHVSIVVHPSGRLINERPAYDVDFEEVMDAAVRTDTALEINCYPKRLDLNDIHVRRAREKGIMISLGTDSHSPEQFEYMDLGVSVARRG